MSQPRAIILHVVRDEILTEYVKHLIFEWEASGKTLVDLERASGARSSGHFSQLKSGRLGASERVVQYMAKAFDKTPLQIRNEAYEYHAREGAQLKKEASGDVDDDGLRHALKAVRAVGATSEGAIRSAIKRWHDMLGKGMTWEWWATQIGEEERNLTLGTHATEKVQRKAKRASTTKRRAIRNMKEEILAPKPEPELASATPSAQAVNAGARKGRR